jgi:hypothetical protein
MLVNEAKWINQAINKYLKDVFGTVINLGSSSMDFIEYNQPYIESLVIEPLARRFTLINVDIKNDKNVNLVADFLTEQGQIVIKEFNAKVILVSNLLEHIPNPLAGINSLKQLVESDSYLILTGPRSFPYHADPIDNMFRPNLAEVQSLFEKDFEIIELSLVRNGTVFTSNFFGRNIKNTSKVIESKGGVLKLFLTTPFIFKTFRNLFYPASAFCMIARKK